MNKFNVRGGLRSLVVNRQLLRSIVVRDIQTRYRGTTLGFLWVLAYPLMMLAVYTFVFGGVFGARWGNKGSMGEFVLMLYCGLIVYGLFSETLTRSPGAVVSNPGYVKKVVFPLELLPVSHLVSSLLNVVIGLALLSLALIAQQQYIPITALLAPLVLAPLLLMTAGLAWFLAAIGVFFRDVGQIIGVAMSLLLFLSPIFYPASSAPVLAKALLNVNPLTYPIEELRGIFLLGVIPSWIHLMVYALFSALMAVCGLWIFQRTRPAFADVV